VSDGQLPAQTQHQTPGLTDKGKQKNDRQQRDEIGVGEGAKGGECRENRDTAKDCGQLAFALTLP
jgi:hypothetical protein